MKSVMLNQTVLNSTTLFYAMLLWKLQNIDSLLKMPQNKGNKYFIPSRQNDSVVNQPVCKSLYIKTLGISHDRVQNLCRKSFETGNAPLESRGGDRRGELYLGRKKSVKKFIESVPVLESHYCRGKNIHRQYVSSDLSIKKTVGLLSNFL
ncbi:hypothetical protein J6590_108266 [Homalodisca vitripennis]|nr:hypothetical protein J6590_108266 [Homalodisca vitripennis]